MNDKPLVSILSPCYNVEQFLPQCLDSIINQTYHNLQIALIDDGSKDGTWQIMQEYAARDSRIEVYHQDNQGVASTRNHLLEMVKGDYVLFVDSDDWCELSMVEFLVGKALQSEADIVVCGLVKNDEVCSDEHVEEAMDRENTIKKFLFHKELSGSLWNKLVKTSLLLGIRFDNRISYGEDALFVWRLLQKVNKALLTDKKCYHYRMNDSSISHASYDERKMSGHFVWEMIAREAKELWPQYADIAEANYAISDMWQLYFAKQCNYIKDDNIRLFQRNVRTHLPMIYRSGLINMKKMIFATIASFSYNACKIFIR